MLRFPWHSIPFLSGEHLIGSPVRKLWGTSVDLDSAEGDQQQHPQLADGVHKVDLRGVVRDQPAFGGRRDRAEYRWTKQNSGDQLTAHRRQAETHPQSPEPERRSQQEQQLGQEDEYPVCVDRIHRRRRSGECHAYSLRSVLSAKHWIGCGSSGVIMRLGG